VIVAHLSDLHLLCLDGVRPWDFLGKRVTGGANLLLNRGGQFPASVASLLVEDLNATGADHVVVSGDLTNLSFEGEFRLVRGILEGLSLPPSEVTVIPGNHDCYTRGSRAQDVFGRAMEPFLRGDLATGGGRGAGGRFPLAKLRGELAVVALDSSRPSAPLLAVGTLGEEQLRRAGELLSRPECRERFRIVVVHHPPVGPHVRWHNRLTDARRLLAMLACVGAELVLHGHEHRLLRGELDGPAGPIPMIGAASGTWIAPKDAARRAQYNLYRIEDGRLVEIRTRVYDPASKRFVALRAA
jgi:3',5'-cyclic AMP phosphodiesterase CpdA